jgi:hypothetical protein
MYSFFQPSWFFSASFALACALRGERVLATCCKGVAGDVVHGSWLDSARWKRRVGGRCLPVHQEQDLRNTAQEVQAAQQAPYLGHVCLPRCWPGASRISYMDCHRWRDDERPLRSPPSHQPHHLRSTTTCFKPVCVGLIAHLRHMSKRQKLFGCRKSVASAE